MGLHPLGPILGQGHAIAAIHLEFRAPGVRRSDLEAGREDQAVHRVFDAIDDHRVLGHAIDALPLGVHQLDVGPVEGRQVLVIEGRALAPLAVPRFERLGRRGILNGGGDPIANLIHLLEIRNLGHQRHLFIGEFRFSLAREQVGEVLEEARPFVTDQILFDRNPGQNRVEVVIAIRSAIRGRAS